MPTATSNEDQLRDNVVAFNTVLGAARNMVARLVSGQGKGITTATTVPEIARFQELFTENRQIIFDEIYEFTKGQFQPAALTLELRDKGLKADGKYGPRTSTALALTMWAQSGDINLINEIGTEAVPSNPSVFTQFYLKKKDLYDRTLAQVPAPQGSPPIPAPVPQEIVSSAQEGGVSEVEPAGAAQVVPAASLPAAIQTFSTSEGTKLVGQGKGKMSFATLLSLGLGVAVLSGIVVWQLKKKKYF